MITRTNPDLTPTNSDNGAGSGFKVNPDTDRFSPRRGEPGSPGYNPRTMKSKSGSVRTASNLSGLRIDFDQALAQIDLTALVRRTCPRERRDRFGCPWHVSASGTSTSLTVYRDDKTGRWWWRCWRCDAKGDGLDWLVRLDGGTRADAARKVLGLPDAPGGRRTSAPRPRPSPPPPRSAPTPTPRAWESPAWQEAVDALVREAEVTLWSEEGRAVLEYLRARHLQEPTLRQFRIGFVPKSRRIACDGRPDGIWVERGVLIPWVSPSAWYSAAPDPDGAPDPAHRWVGANVRRLPLDLADFHVKERTPDPKYMAVSGSERGHLYPQHDPAPGIPALVVEGELDALVGWQECGQIVNVASVGGASQTPQPEALDALAGCPSWLVLPDADGAGEGALEKWESIDADAVVPVMLTGGHKDITDFATAGGDVPGWLEGEFRSMGWEWPLRRAGEVPEEHEPPVEAPEVGPPVELLQVEPSAPAEPDRYDLILKDWLRDLVEDGSLLRHLGERSRDRAERLLAQDELDIEPARSLIHETMAQSWPERYRAANVRHELLNPSDDAHGEGAPWTR
jgi:hypothetical protein